MTTCKNCGAILHNNKCEYCGSDYTMNGNSGHFSPQEVFGTLNYGDEEIKVYISNMEAHTVQGEPWKDFEGNIHRSKLKMYRTFVLTEVLE